MVDKHQQEIIPLKDRKRIRDRKIRALYFSAPASERPSMAEIAAEVNRLGYNVSVTTVFFAINGRSTKKTTDHKRQKRVVNRLLNNPNNIK